MAPFLKKEDTRCREAHHNRNVWITSRLLKAVEYVAPPNPHALRYARHAFASKSLAGRSRLCASTCCPQIVTGAVALT